MESDEIQPDSPEPGPSDLAERAHEEEEDEEEATTEKIMSELESAWLNEKFAPELLPHRNDLVDCMLLQISYLEDQLQRILKNDVRYNIHTMEISRVRFLISSYLRKRLEKIEEFAIYLLSEDSKRDPEDKYMTPAEQIYAKEFLQNMETLFTNVALKHMPNRIGTFEVDKMTSRPNFNWHVFVRSNCDVPGIFVSDSEGAHDFAKGSQHIVQYNVVEQLVKDRLVQLI